MQGGKGKTFGPQFRGDAKFLIQVVGLKSEYQQNALQNKSSSSNLLSMMEKDEKKELHLHQALANQFEIPTPDVIEIDEEIYNKLYPPVTLPKRRVIAFPHDHDEIIEYDIDSCDSLWIAKQPNWNLSLDMFERVMEWLENSSELQVPTLDALLTQPFVKNIKFNTIEEIYDHWLEKRLECKQKLLHRVKKESKRKRSKLHKSDDPYIAFRQCPEKMHTRKNRAADHENYIKMLHRKREMLQYMKAAQGLRRTEKKKNQALKMKLAMFEDQYRTRNFLEPLLTPPVEFFDILALSESEESESEAEMCEETSIELEDKETFNFDRRRGCQYYAPISDDSGLGWSDAAEELPQKFHQTSEGPRRKRIGRGGRLLFDRKTSNGAQERCTDYDKFDVNATVKCKRLPTDISLQTSFSLSNSTEIPEECFEIELVIDVDAQFE